jgi:hypothetical protein
VRLATAFLALLAVQQAGGVQAAPTLEHGVAVLQGLDKVTARVSEFRAPLDRPTRFGTLQVIARTCRETPPTEPPESAAFLEIEELPPASAADQAPVPLFSGWMFASSPAVSALEHPVYDIWVVDCAEPVEDPANAAQGEAETTGPASE